MPSQHSMHQSVQYMHPPPLPMCNPGRPICPVSVSDRPPVRRRCLHSAAMRVPSLRWSQWAGRRLAVALTPQPVPACAGRAPSRSLATSSPLAMIKVPALTEGCGGDEERCVVSLDCFD